jgi:hypothetical protein
MSHLDTLRSAHDAFNAQDFGVASQLVSPTGVVVDHGRGIRVEGREAFAGWMKGFFEMASDVQLVDRTYVDGGAHVTAMFRATGTQDGPIGPFPASGKLFTLDVCEVWHFGPDGTADEGHNYSDGLGLMTQLGHIGG